MKHLEDAPWWICDNDDINYAAYCDTDSVYLNAEPLLLHLHPDFEDKDDDEKDNILEGIALKYQDIITNHYNILAKECFNVLDHRLEMKTEAEFMKANFPPILGEFFNNILEQVLKGTKHDEILVQIKDFKQQILTGTIPITKLGNPTRVTKLEKYSGQSARSGEMFAQIEKGAPAPVRAAIRYNDLLKFWQLDKKHNYITQADKVKWVYLQNNPYKIEALAFFDYDMPPKIMEFLEKYVDRQKIFDSILLNKLEGFFSDLGWQLDLNPYKNAFSFFEV